LIVAGWRRLLVIIGGAGGMFCHGSLRMKGNATKGRESAGHRFSICRAQRSDPGELINGRRADDRNGSY
jgi:hypothetical protein